jgi:hypothetical protein
LSTNLPADPADSTGAKRPNQKIDKAFEEVARLSGMDLPPSEFFQKFLEVVLEGIEAPAGAVWLRNPQGFLQLQCQLNIDNVGLDKHKNGRQSHNELLRQAFQTAKPILLEPFGSTGILEGIPAGNPTDYIVFLAPVLLDEKNALGLVEVWQDPRFDPRTKRVHLNFLVQMAGYAASFFRNQQGRQSVNQEQLWSQLEAFACQIHATLDPTVVAYHVANEGRRLIGCDRLSVATREGKKAKIEAVSGADVVEKRATQVKLMRKLCEAVIKWEEKLVYRGVKDDGLPPAVYEALDKYLAESNAKLLVLMPLRDKREKDKESKEYKPGKARSALLMECYEPPAQPEPLFARLDVIGRHAGSALYNALEMRKIPLSLMWKPVLMVQEGLGSKARLYMTLGAIATVAIILAMIFVPYELKMDAKGQLMPLERRTVYSPRQGRIVRFNVERNIAVPPGGVLVEMFDPELAQKMVELNGKIIELEASLRQIDNQRNNYGNRTELESFLQKTDYYPKKISLATAVQELNRLKDDFNTNSGGAGAFSIRAPVLVANAARDKDPLWKVLSGNDFKSELENRTVKPSDPLFKIGDINGTWEVEIKIPQKHIGQVRLAYKTSDPKEELDVDLKLESHVTKTFRGKLAQKKVGSEASPNKDDHNETEPVVYCYVRVSGDDINPEDQIPVDLNLANVGVRAKVRCGKHAMGYSLFYGVWEFLNEKAFQYF